MSGRTELPTLGRDALRSLLSATRAEKDNGLLSGLYLFTFPRLHSPTTAGRFICRMPCLPMEKGSVDSCCSRGPFTFQFRVRVLLQVQFRSKGCLLIVFVRKKQEYKRYADTSRKQNTWGAFVLTTDDSNLKSRWWWRQLMWVREGQTEVGGVEKVTRDRKVCFGETVSCPFPVNHLQWRPNVLPKRWLTQDSPLWIYFPNQLKRETWTAIKVYTMNHHGIELAFICYWRSRRGLSNSPLICSNGTGTGTEPDQTECRPLKDISIKCESACVALEELQLFACEYHISGKLYSLGAEWMTWLDNGSCNEQGHVGI